MKKRLFLGNRIELVYTVSILVIVLILMGFFYLVVRDYITADRKENLVETTNRTMMDISIEHGRLDVDQDVSYSSDGAFVVLTDRNGKIIDGALGHAFTDTAPFQDGKVRMIRENGEKYFIYDRALWSDEENDEDEDEDDEDEDEEEVEWEQTLAEEAPIYWLRGVTSAEFSEMAPSLDGSLRMVSRLLPLFLLAVIFAGWLVTRRALKPLREITRTAELIQKEGDLSRRIGIRTRGNHDEIQHTAEVFDSMLEKIEQLFEREKKFTDDASHELRTPVAVVMAECEYALDNLDDPEEVESALRSILEESHHLSDLVSTLLLFARADRGMYELSREWTDLSLLAEECCARVRPKAEAKNIALAVDAPESVYTCCDQLLMGRALDNLLTNGIKYGREEGFVQVKVEAKSEEVRITVEDDGIGIPPAEMEKIWGRFYRAENAAAHTDVDGDDQSMGLGLSLVRWICETHGGSAACENRPEGGSRFIMKIPLIHI